MKIFVVGLENSVWQDKARYEEIREDKTGSVDMVWIDFVSAFEP